MSRGEEHSPYATPSLNRLNSSIYGGLQIECKNILLKESSK